MPEPDLDAINNALDTGMKCIIECLEEIQDWRACALAKGWDRSALKRCRKKYIEPKCPLKTPT